MSAIRFHLDEVEARIADGAKLEPGRQVVYLGSVWNVRSVDRDRNAVMLEPA